MTRSDRPVVKIVAVITGGLVLLVLGVYFIHQLVGLPARSVNEARRVLEGIAASFQSGTVTLEFRDYVTEVRGLSRLQVAQLKSVDTFSRTDSTAIFWDSLRLPDVRVQLETPVEYTYYLDLDGPWRFTWHEPEQAIVVEAPPIRAGTPAVDLAGLKLTILEGSFLRDEEAAQEKLKAQMPELLHRMAWEKIPLVRETARRQTRLFVENWFVKVRFQNATIKPHVRDVVFADEVAAPPLTPEK
jgi:hypothetical protein